MAKSNGDDYVCFWGAIHKVDQTIWISMMEFNALIKVDIETGYVQLVDCFDIEWREGNLHLQIVSYQNKVIFLPWNAENIAIFDLNNAEMRYVPVYGNGNPGLFGDGIRNGKYLYLMSESAKEIIQFDMESEKIVDDCILEDAEDQEPFAIYSYVKPIKINDGIWKISGHKNMSWKFQLKDKRFIVKECLLEQEINFIAGNLGQDCLWLIADNDMIYQFSTKFVLRRKYDISRVMGEVFEKTKRESFDCICLSNYLIIVFCDKKAVVKIPVIDNCLDLGQYQCRKYRNACFSIEDDKLVIVTAHKAVLIEEEGEREVIFSIPREFSLQVMRKKHGFLKECDAQTISLSNFISYVGNGCITPCRKESEVSVGKRIIDVIKSEKI